MMRLLLFESTRYDELTDNDTADASWRALRTGAEDFVNGALIE